MKLATRFKLGLLLIVVVAGGGLYAVNNISHTTGKMSPPAFKRNDRGRYVVLQMHWAPKLQNNISWNLGSGRGGSGTFEPGNTTKPFRRTAYAAPGAQVTFGWAFVNGTPERFKWELWTERPNGTFSIMHQGTGPVNAAHQGPFTVN